MTDAELIKRLERIQTGIMNGESGIELNDLIIELKEKQNQSQHQNNIRKNQLDFIERRLNDLLIVVQTMKKVQ